MWKFALMALWLISMSIFDLIDKRVPVWLLTVGGIPAIATAMYAYVKGTGSLIQILWGMFPGILLLAVAVLTKKAGWADGIVLLIMGLFTDLWECMVCFAVSLVIMSVVSLLLLVLRKAGRNTILPYIPFLCAGYLVSAVALFA